MSIPSGQAPLGHNKGGYRGELIAIDRVIDEVRAEALKHGWHSDRFLASERLSLWAYHRFATQARKRLYLSSGIHGDEPAGPMAILELLKQNRWPSDIDLWLCPCLNPSGFLRNTRENEQGIDLNRDYRHLAAEEVRAHVEWLHRQPRFDLTLVLHEDWEARGFYLYEVNPDQLPSFAEIMIGQVARVCPIDTAASIDGWPARAGIIRPQIDPKERPQWPEAAFLISHKTRQSYTLEAPSDFPLTTRVAALATAVEAAMWKL